ncbi:MAG TPA: hypothetical protein VFQ53_20990 [Kofleriaceae bacterium]|nr:hypothetical protein [Kofleriaceae bacterium]
MPHARDELDDLLELIRGQDEVIPRLRPRHARRECSHRISEMSTDALVHVVDADRARRRAPCQDRARGCGDRAGAQRVRSRRGLGHVVGRTAKRIPPAPSPLLVAGCCHPVLHDRLVGNRQRRLGRRERGRGELRELRLDGIPARARPKLVESLEQRNRVDHACLAKHRTDLTARRARIDRNGGRADTQRLVADVTGRVRQQRRATRSVCSDGDDEDRPVRSQRVRQRRRNLLIAPLHGRQLRNRADLAIEIKLAAHQLHHAIHHAQRPPVLGRARIARHVDERELLEIRELRRADGHELAQDLDGQVGARWRRERLREARDCRRDLDAREQPQRIDLDDRQPEPHREPLERRGAA